MGIIVWTYGVQSQPHVPTFHLGVFQNWSASLAPPTPVPPLTSTARIWTGVARSRIWTGPGS